MRSWLTKILAMSAALTLTVLMAPSAGASTPSATSSAEKKCTPSLAVRVGWKNFDTYYLAMQTHVLVANCGARVKSVRVTIRSFRAAGTGLVDQDSTIRGIYPSKYGNTSMMIHVNKFLRAVYIEGDSGPVKGIVLDDKWSYHNLQSCSLMTDATPINTSDFTFTVRVEPLDGNKRVIPNVGAAVVGPFTCGQIAGT